MPVAAYFHPEGMTLETYYEIHRRLEAAGVGLSEQSGRLHHSCFGEDGDLMVYDVWESPEAFEAFGAHLIPIVTDLGVDLGQPDVLQVHMIDQVAAEGSIPE